MKKSIFLLLIIFTFCTEKEITPSLYPTSVEKTIERYNFCLNHILDPFVFETLDEIIVGELQKEFKELNELLSSANLAQSSNLGHQLKPSASIQLIGKKFRKQLELFIVYAKELRIKILKVKHLGNKAEVKAIFFDDELIFEERKKIFLVKVKDLWKIEKIIPLEVKKKVKKKKKKKKKKGESKK